MLMPEGRKLGRLRIAVPAILADRLIDLGEIEQGGATAASGAELQGDDRECQQA